MNIPYSTHNMLWITLNRRTGMNNGTMPTSAQHSVWYFWDTDHQFSVTTAVQCLSFVLIIVHKISYHTPLSRPHVCEMFQVDNVFQSITVQRLIL